MLSMKNDDGIIQQEILDLGAARRGEINETFLSAFGNAIKMMLSWTFGNNVFFPKEIKGTQREVQSFTNALQGERDYMKTYMRLGLNNPQTYKNKYKLDKAVKNFEQATKLKWPFK
jgi:hypothetical protein